MFNLIGSSPQLKELGFSVDVAEKLSSVSYESYRQCMAEYDKQKEDDRIRKGGGGGIAMSGLC
jgi:CRISPR/Cas system CSM-associated protein Csm5 (group 7 of RAMP superfamily)